MKRYLVLENGEVFAGLAFGAPCDTVGELVFTTGMNGYIETLTDPSYCGQIVLQTFPLIGNYGIIPADFEGKCCVRGYVVREQCQTPSNFRCEETLDAFLKENHIPGIAGIDTRAVTRILREAGTMNAAICDTVPDDLAPLRAYRITDPVPQVTTPEPYTLQPEGATLHRVALIDYGAKRNIARELCKRGCAVTVLPCSAKAEDILAAGYDGVMLSNGPGDPTDNVSQIAEIAKLFGVNQPARDVCGTRTFLTSQNHGYAVVPESVKTGVIRYVNANDGTCEGIDYPDLQAFSVQFHPEACSGPHDTAFLFDRFCDLMGGAHHAD